MFGHGREAMLFVVAALGMWFPRTAETLAAAAPPPAGVAAPAEAGLLRLSTSRVIVFKDGHGLFAKKATGVAGPDGTVFTGQVPDAAVLGTFWATAEGFELRSMTAGWHETTGERTEESSCLTTLELLRANPGKAVTLYLEGKELSGRLVEVLEAPAKKPTRAELLAALRLPPGEEGAMVERELTPKGGELLVVDGTERGRLVLPVAEVKSVAGKELLTHCRRTKQSASRHKRLTFDLGRAAAGKKVSLHLFYFTPGIRWIPTYRVDTGPGERAVLSLQGELLNEEEDIEDAPVDLVVGVPSFRFKDTVSPLSLEQTLRSALAQAAPGLMGQGLSNANFYTRAGERYAAHGDEGAAALASAPELSGEQKQDLFVYGVKSLSLKKGGRAALPLWRSSVPQRHVYTLDLALRRSGSSYSYGREEARSPLKLAENKVWHQLELSDTTGVPWTTGAALLLQDGFPLGQDVLAYTSPGGRTLLPVTVATDLRAVHSETELERKPDALRIDGSSYSQVRKRGTLTLVSHRKERSTLRISVSTGGRIEKASDGGEVKLDDQRGDDFADGRLGRANNHSDVSWELTLAPGETRTLSYALSLYE